MHLRMGTTCVVLLASAWAAGALQVRGGSLGRREASLRLAAAAAGAGGVLPALADVPLPEYDEEGRPINLKGYSEETLFREVRTGPASVRVLAAWKQADDGVWIDPTLGSATNRIEMRAMETQRSSTADLGRPEKLDLVKELNLEPDLVRADLVAAAVRSADGISFYDFDLALPAKKCAADLATACLPQLVVLLSCGVREGKLHVMRVDADPGQWKRSGRALRLLRDL